MNIVFTNPEKVDTETEIDEVVINDDDQEVVEVKKKKRSFNFFKKRKKDNKEIEEMKKEDSIKNEITILDKIKQTIEKESEKSISVDKSDISEQNNIEITLDEKNITKNKNSSKNIDILEDDKIVNVNIPREEKTKILESNNIAIKENSEKISTVPKMVPKVGRANFIPFEFRGSASEYFKIWIVNIALTLLTLGIYSAWAKVRTLRYIYGNTYLNNSNFEFNADPKRILIGRIIIVAFYGLFLLFSDYLAMYKIAAGIFVVFLLLLPWLIRQAISFKLRSTSYRNIPFKFHAKVRSFYWLVIFSFFSIISLPLIIVILSEINPVIAGILAFVAYFLLFVVVIPVLYRRYKSLVINNTSYANAFFRFTATKKDAVAVFVKMSFLTFGISLLLGVLTALTIGMGSSLIGLLHIPTNNIYYHYLLTGFGMLMYLIFVGMYKGVSDGYLSNFVRNNTVIKDAKFKGEISPFKLGLISATNAIALVFSLGLLFPWTKLRYLRHKIENTHFACSDYDQFVSAGYEKTNPLGEEALDFFDIDIGV